MSVARFIADQRTFYRVPYAVCCVILGVSQSWFYKWFNRPATTGQRRRAELDAAVLKMFNASTRTYGSPRIHADLLEAGWMLSVNTVADSMRRQGLQGRKPKHSKGLTRQDRKAPKFPDLLKRDFTAPGPNVKWCGDITEIPTDEGKLYMATVLDLFSRRLLACPTSEHPNSQLVCDGIKIAAAAWARIRDHSVGPYNNSVIMLSFVEAERQSALPHLRREPPRGLAWVRCGTARGARRVASRYGKARLREFESSSCSLVQFTLVHVPQFLLVNPPSVLLMVTVTPSTA